MDIQNISAILFILLMVIFLLIKRKKITIQKILFPLLYFVMYRTQLGIKFMEKFSKKFSKQLKYIGYFAIFIGVLGMIVITFALGQNIYNILTKPEAAPGVGLVLPFQVKGAFYVPFFYWIISIFIIAVVHEFSHGIMAKKYNMRIKSSGMAFLGILLPVVPAAFVEPDEKEIQKRPPREQLSVYAAGPFSNILLALIIVGITALVIPYAAANIIQSDGVLITGVMESMPAHQAGIEGNEKILTIDNINIENSKNFSKILKDKRPGDTIILITNRSTYNITLAENPEDKNKAYVGVYIKEKTKVNENFNRKYGKFTSSSIIWFLGLLYWLYVLNLGIGLFNLAPMGPLDGGRMLLVALKEFFEEKKAVIIWKKVGLIFLALVLINIAFAFIK